MTIQSFAALLKACFFMVTVAMMSGSAAHAQGADPLPSWNDGAAKRAVLAFVERVTTEGGRDFVPVAERIAVFDNDGTLWAEQPFYFQGMFAFDRVRALAPQHPEWKDKEPFASDQATANGWTVVDMKQDWKRVFEWQH